MNQELVKTLQRVGLTQSEAGVYLVVLEHGRTTVSAIARASKMNRRNIYDVLNTLLDKGLIFTMIGEKETFYAGVPPEKLLEMIQSKELALARALPELQELYTHNHVPEKALMYQGIEGFKQCLQDILNVGEDVRSVGAKGWWRSKDLEDFVEWYEQERLRKKIRVYNLYDESMRQFVNQNLESHYAKLREYCFLPKEISTNSTFEVFGNHIVTFTGLDPEQFDSNVRLFVIINQQIADAFRTWFQFMWDQCETL